MIHFINTDAKAILFLRMIGAKVLGIGLGLNLGGPRGGALSPPITLETYGALSRNQVGAGIVTTATAIVSGNDDGHWSIGSGRLYPSASGDTANMNAGPYLIELDNGDVLQITIEANTWDVTDQSEWNVIALQSAATLAGKTIALRNPSTLALGITGASGTPFRRADFRASGVPCTVKGRLGEVGDFASYCEIDRVASMRGARGVKFQHLRTTAVAEGKFGIIGEAAQHIEDITIHDCWVSGEVDDPNGDFSTSSNYANNGIDLIVTTGSIVGTVGNITITDCLIEWGASLINIAVTKAANEAVITGNTCRYFYDDAIACAMGGTSILRPVTISDNFLIDCVGLSTDSGTPHPDYIRLIANNTATADWTGIVIENNICLQGTARGGAGGIFLDDLKTSGGDSGHFFTATIRNNIVALFDAVNSIVVGQAKDCLIDNNTVAAWGAANTFTASYRIGATGSTMTNGGGNVISDNIGDGFAYGGSDTATNNFVAGLNGVTIPYSTLFDGPTYAPTTRAQAIALFNTKVAAGAVIA